MLNLCGWSTSGLVSTTALYVSSSLTFCRHPGETAGSYNGLRFFLTNIAKDQRPIVGPNKPKSKLEHRMLDKKVPSRICFLAEPGAFASEARKLA